MIRAKVASTASAAKPSWSRREGSASAQTPT